MRAEAQAVVDDIRESLALIRRHLDWDAAQERLNELNAEVENPELWNDAERAQKIMRERQTLESALNTYASLEQRLRDNIELIEMAEAEGEDEVISDAQAALETLRQDVQKQEVEALLSGEADANDCYVEIHSGAGGTESQDWAQMLMRMYMRWAESRGYKVEVVEYQDGEEAGIKSATLQVQGHNAYGWLKTESGVHRLVRISPFDSNARRHTSFASVWTYPVIDDNIEIEVNESDCRIDTYRASGAGGQHVNTTDSAVRITHQPTGIVVQCQNERSQHKNRAAAWAMLRSRLYEMELQKREEAAHAESASKTDIGWGHQIRSYVLQPYQLVKDLRTGLENTNPSAVLDGEITPFIEAALAQRVKGGAEAETAEAE
ncbi:peptide chain release factor 2 [Dichotomicrobium thermohalophilum]|uniref:Peptide chain release factor 2 n=1 Tax=Dichotomicrobium thermohalophilum TaxID=933063 RepID=A0A397Q6N3_9HYPH|nr:peptide chain release factor 2 [Dichotomicrobium thermohalophilum]RIA56708.1 peptide chain release factor 2 (bRF-2) [Dichotomicrobium thermohalophilum]